MSCASCGVDGATSRCVKCKSAYYCNAECQKKHWGIHRAQCSSKKLLVQLEVVDDEKGEKTVKCLGPVPAKTCLFTHSKAFLQEIPNHLLSKEQRQHTIGGLRPNYTIYIKEGAEMRWVRDNVNLDVLRRAAHNNDYPAFIRECYARPANAIIGLYMDGKNINGAKMVTIRDIPAGSFVICHFGVGYWAEQFAHAICTDDPMSIWNAQGWIIHGGDEDAIRAMDECIDTDRMVAETEFQALAGRFPSFLIPDQHAVFSLMRNTDKVEQMICIDKKMLNPAVSMVEKQTISVRHRLTFISGQNADMLDAVTNEIALVAEGKTGDDILEMMLASASLS